MTRPEWIQELRQKAEKAGFGKWTSSEHLEKEVGTEAAVWGSDGDSIALVYTNLGLGIYAEDLAPYIAATSPDRLLELLSLLDEQQSKVESLEARVKELEAQMEAAKVEGFNEGIEAAAAVHDVISGRYDYIGSYEDARVHEQWSKNIHALKKGSR